MLNRTFGRFALPVLPILLIIMLTSCTGSRNIARVNTTKPFFTDQELVMYDFAQAETGAHIFIPKEKKSQNDIVVFLHGYGAMNPFIYGGWIRHLVNQGHIVIYPRYQEKILKTSAKAFVPNTVTGIQSAFQRLKKLKIPFDATDIHIVGHSYGGVIAANLAAHFKEYNLPEPKSVFVCQGGTGPFKGGILEDYSEISPKTLLTIIVGDNDQTVGTKFGDYLWEKINEHEQKAYVHHFEPSECLFTASHYEPYSIDTTLDIGTVNFTSNKCLRVAKTDELDEKLYWAIFDGLIDISSKKRDSPLSHHIKNFVMPLDSFEGLVEIK